MSGRRHSGTLIIFCASLVVPVLRAAGPRVVQVDVVRIDGKSYRGALESLTPEIALQTPDGPLQLAWNELLELRPTISTATPATRPQIQPSDETLWIAALDDGSQLIGGLGGGDERGIQLRRGDGREVRIDARHLLSLSRSAVAAGGSEPPMPPAELLAQLASPEGEKAEDACLIERGTNRATLRGVLRGTSAKGLIFERGGKELVVPWDRLVALRTAQSPARPANIAVRLRDGAVLCGRITAGDETGVSLASSVLGTLSLEWSEILRVEVRSERLVLLTDLRMARYEMQPLLGVRVDAGIDHAPGGGPLTLRGQPLARGLVLHSRALAAYEIGGRFRQFAARVAIVDEMRMRGDAAVRVRGDGRVLWEAERVRGGEAPRDVLVDIGGVKELTLEVDYGRDLDLSDQVVFGLARLIR